MSQRKGQNMTEEQQQALATLVEWRNGVHTALLENKEIGSDYVLLMTLVGIRKAMNDTAVAFGLESCFADSSLTESVR